MTKMFIPQRDKSQIAKAKPWLCECHSHEERVRIAFNYGFMKYHKALYELSKK